MTLFSIAKEPVGRTATSWILFGCCALLGAIAPGAGAAADGERLLGFDVAGSVTEHELERRFDTGLDANEQREWLQQMASAANQVGSTHDKANAQWMVAQLSKWGWDAHVETFYAMIPMPLEQKLEMADGPAFSATLQEPPIATDHSSAQTQEMLPSYLAFQGDGDVTAELVYANRGMPEDYEELDRAGLDVRGKIVITRYGGGWRGLKPQLAQERGALGCLIYSDPADDGYGVGDVYPTGATRPPRGLQRGSVLKIMLYPGDPLTPGTGATAHAKRLSREEAQTLLKIPALAISYADAQPLLAALSGPVAPKSFRGQLPLTYHLGPSKAKVHLLVRSDWSLKPVYDVIAMMKGAQWPDQWVIRGNHHDGWVFGTQDPLAGNVALLQEAKALGLLAKSGWRPRRTLVYASWDAEEEGMIGSTEWAEVHAKELQRKAVMYVNSDTNARGFLLPQATHELQGLLNQVASDVPDPQTHVSVQARLRAGVRVRALFDPEYAEYAQAIRPDGAVPVAALGSGTDYTAFLSHLGIPSISIGFGGEDQDDGIGHSSYDTFEHFVRFGDPTLEYGVALSKTAGRLVLRAGQADILPMRFGELAETMHRYVESVKKLHGDLQIQSAIIDQLVRNKDFQLAVDPTVVTLTPPPQPAVPAVDFGRLDGAVERLAASAKAYDDALSANPVVPRGRVAQINRILQSLDQTLLDPSGLPGRPWFKNLLYAPGMLTGYEPKTLPGVREALEGHRWAQAQSYVGATATVLEAYAAQLDRASALLRNN